MAEIRLTEMAGLPKVAGVYLKGKKKKLCKSENINSPVWSAIKWSVMRGLMRELMRGLMERNVGRW